jgi:citrate synthase
MVQSAEKIEQNSVNSNFSTNNSPLMAIKESLTITDNRTGETREVLIHDNTVNCTDLTFFKDQQGEVLRSYDPAYMNTVCCTSSISYIDGDRGILEYRGYPIE